MKDKLAQFLMEGGKKKVEFLTEAVNLGFKPINTKNIVKAVYTYLKQYDPKISKLPRLIEFESSPASFICQMKLNYEFNPYSEMYNTDYNNYYDELDKLDEKMKKEFSKIGEIDWDGTDLTVIVNLNTRL